MKYRSLGLPGRVSDVDQLVARLTLEHCDVQRVMAGRVGSDFG